MTDEHLAKLTTYYHYHDIANKLTLIFSDFVTCVESGRWAEFMRGRKKIIEYDDTTKKTPYSTINVCIGDSGYEVHEFYNGVTTIMSFGVESNSREQAFTYYKSRTGEHDETLLCI